MYLLLHVDGKPYDAVRARWTAYTGHRGVRSPLWEARGTCGCLWRGSSLWRCLEHANVRSAELVSELPREKFGTHVESIAGGAK